MQKLMQLCLKPLDTQCDSADVIKAIDKVAKKYAILLLIVQGIH